MSEWLDRLAHAPDGFLIFAAVLGIVALVIAFMALMRVRRIEDVPTARVRSAPQGYVELVGTARAMPGTPIVAPLSSTPCCWFSYRVERRSDNEWRVQDSGTSDGIFMLRDDSGDCIVDPEGAEVTTSHNATWSDNGGGRGGHGVHARLPSLGRGADLLVNVGGKVLESLGSGSGEYRYIERVILDGDPLYAIGEFHSLGSRERADSLHELTGAILREWKQHPDTLLERFDRNRDGSIDQHEWEQARAAAAREAQLAQAESLAAGPTHTLRRPADGRYFMLSNLEEFALLRRYRWRARLGFAAFAVLGAAVAVMLTTRL